MSTGAALGGPDPTPLAEGLRRAYEAFLETQAQESRVSEPERAAVAA